VERAERPHGLLHRLLRVRFIRHAAGDRDRATARGRNGVDQAIELRLASRCDDDRRALTSENACDRFADAGARAGHERDLALHSHVGSSDSVSSPVALASASGAATPPRAGQNPGSTFRATVMNPECATMRWSGRTLRPWMFQVRSSVSKVWIKPKTPSRSKASTVCWICGTVGTKLR